MRTVFKGLLATTLASMCIAGASLGQTITQWNFNSVPPDALSTTGSDVPSTGAGTLALVATTTTFSLGSPSDPAATDNTAKSTSGYPAQGVGSGTAGIRFNVSTVGKNNINVTYDQRNSNSASAWWRFEYSTDGTTFVSTGLPTAGAGAGEYQFPVANAGNWAPTYLWSLAAIPAVNNNANFAFRIVSIFDPSTGTSYASSNGVVAYGTTGTARYDMVTVTQGTPTGACCVTASTVCSVTTEAACTGIWSNGVACTANSCSGACCTGGACAAPVSPVDCQNANTQDWTSGATCTPNPCPREVAVQAGDIAFAANVSVLSDSVQQIRGANGAGPAPTRVGTWGGGAFIEFIKFDNTGGPHAANGNLLAMDFGATPTTGGTLYNFSTNGTGGTQLVYTFGPANVLGLPNSRVGGFGVSANNQLLGIGAVDTGQIIIAKYTAGATTGTGAGASLTGGTATDATTFQIASGTGAAGATPGVVWISNTQAAVFVKSTDPLGFYPPNTVAIFTIDYNPGTNTITAVTPRVAPDDTGVPDASRFLSMAYVPSVSPFIYTSSSGFTTLLGSHTRVNVIDPVTWTSVKSIVLDNPTPNPAPNGSLQTGRALSVGPDRYLYLSEFAGSTATATDAIIDRINLDTNASGTVTGADNAALADNSSTDFWLKGGATTASFNGLDVAITAPAPSTGVCCNGAACISNVAAGSCTGVHKFFVSSTAVCNVAGNYKTPCCKADYTKTGGITVQDIFDYLAAWFAKDISADINGATPAGGNIAVTVQDIFDFLAAYFAKGCTTP